MIRGRTNYTIIKIVFRERDENDLMKLQKALSGINKVVDVYVQKIEQ